MTNRASNQPNGDGTDADIKTFRQVQNRNENASPSRSPSRRSHSLKYPSRSFLYVSTDVRIIREYMTGSRRSHFWHSVMLSDKNSPISLTAWFSLPKTLSRIISCAGCFLAVQAFHVGSRGILLDRFSVCLKQKKTMFSANLGTPFSPPRQQTSAFS